jgi:hypothetical protein
MAKAKRKHLWRRLDARRVTIVVTAGTSALVVAGAALAITAALVTPNGSPNGTQIAQKIVGQANPTHDNANAGAKKADAKDARAKAAKAIAAADTPMPGSDVNFAEGPSKAGSAAQSWWQGGHAPAGALGTPMNSGASDSYTIAASGDALPGAGGGSSGSYSDGGDQGSYGSAPSGGVGPGPANFPPTYQANNGGGPGPYNPGTPYYRGPGSSNPGNSSPGNGHSPGNKPSGPTGPSNGGPPPQLAQLGPNTSGPGGSGTPPTSPLPGQTAGNPLKPAGGTNPDVLTCVSPECGTGWTYLDPEVAIGYNFQLVPGKTTAASDGVTKISVSTDVGNGQYQFWMLNVAGTWVDMAPIDANPGGISADDFDVVSFLDGLTAAEDTEFGITDPADGLTQFSIRGIDPSAGLDPSDPDEFVTGVQFSSPFEGKVYITPLALDTITDAESYSPTYDPPVPEPPALPVFAAALGLALMWREVRRFRPRPS